MLEQKSKSRARVKVAFFCVVGVHVAAILVALLAQGCKREPTPTTDNAQPPVPEATNNLPVLDAANTAAPTNYVPPVPEPPPVLAAQEYVIQQGDTFSSIAPKFHVTVKALQTANPTVDPARLQIGKKIIIPPPTTTAPTAGVAAPTADTSEQLYTVKSGDSLTKIAAEHHTTVNALRKANPQLTTDRITVGQKLKIPAKSAATPAPIETAPVPAPSSSPAPAAVPPTR